MKKIFTLCVVLCMSYLSMGATNLKHEFRATWLTTAWGNDWPKTKVTNDATRKQQQDSLIAIFDRLQAGNMNAVCFQVRGRSDAFYESSYEPWAAELAGARGKDPGYDPLAFAIEEAHKRGLELHAWVNPFRVTSSGTLSTSDKVWLNAGQWIIQYNNGSFSGQIIDPGYPEAREYVLNVLMEIVNNYDIDGIVMDDYFYPYGGTTTEDAASKALYKPNNVVDVNQDGDTDDDWRRSNVDVFLEELYNQIQATKPWVRFGMGTFGIWTTQTKVAQAYGISLPSGISGLDDYDEQACNPVEWVKNGYVDYINPQLYWPTTSTGQNYNKLCHWWAKDVCEHFSNQLTNGKKVHFFSSQSISANPTLTEIQSEIDVNRNNLSSGSTGSVFFDTDAYLTMDKDLMTSRFATNALTPPMDWKSNTALAAPTNLTVSGSTLSWQHAMAERFTVYVYPKGTAWSTAKNDPSYLQGVIYGNTMDISGIDTNMNDIAVCAYDRFGVEHTAAVYSNDSGAGTTPNPETIIWELNGGEVNTVTVEVPSLTTLEAQFKNDYNSYFGASVATTREITNFLYYGSKEEGGSNLVYNMMNDPASDWTWLRDYIISKSASNTTIQTALLAGTDAHWRYSIVAFLTASAGTNSTYTVDFSIAGQPSKWGTAYQIAHGAVLLPTYVTSAYTLPTPVHPSGYEFLGWYDNAEFAGSPLTTIPANWTGTLYAQWQENAPTIDPTWQITYTSTDGNIVTPHDTTGFGANIVSNTYENGVGTITFDGSVTSIGDWAFERCPSLTSITIPESVTSIGYAAFCDCTSLTSITIPNGVTSIGEYAFSYCNKLNTMVVEEGNTKYDSRENCNAIIEKATNTLIAGCQNTIIPNTVTSIENGAFRGCPSLTSITIPESVTSIGTEAFAACPSLTSMVVEPGNTTFDSRENCNAIIEKATNTLIAGCQNTVIPNTVTSIGWDAFSYCTSLASITIPNSVTSIGGWAFRDCTSLASVTIGSGVKSIGRAAFAGCTSLTSITIPDNVTSIGDVAFAGCSSLTSVTIPNSVTNIGESAFEGCSSITSITIPNSVTSIGDWAFQTCTSLTSITIPNSVTSIGYSAFYRCTSLTSIAIPNSVTSIGYGAFRACYSLTSMVVEPGNTTYDSRENCNAIIETATNTLIAGCQKTLIPNTVTSIGEFAFWDCTSLTSITIPESVTSIGYWAFNECTSLTSITIPNSVTSIGVLAFAYCSSLASVTLGSGVTSIGERAFDYCTSLTSITCEATTPPTLGSDVFPSELTTAYIPCGTKEAYEASAWAQYVREFIEEGCPKITYELNGGLPNEYGWQNKNDMFQACMADCGVTTLPLLDEIKATGNDAALTTICTKLTDVSGMLNSDKWEWLEQYIMEVQNAQVGNVVGSSFVPAITTTSDAVYWRYALAAFFVDGQRTAWPYSADFSQAGMDEAYIPAWKQVYTYPTSVTSEFTLYDPYRKGYTFLGWYTNADFSGEKVTTINAETTGTLYAKWINNDWIITYTSTDGNIVTPYATDVFGANIVSNTYENGVGTITFDGPVTSIGEEAFRQCSSIASITIPKSVTSIGQFAFGFCSSLTSITIPENVTSIVRGTFQGCSSIVSIVVDNNNTMYDSRNDCNAIIETATNVLVTGCKNTIIPNGITTIDRWAFASNKSLTSITIPNTVMTIADHAFHSCSSLPFISIPNSVTSIGVQAFYNCSLFSSFTIPKSVTTIGKMAFNDCTSLDTIYVEATTPPTLGENVLGYSPVFTSSPLCYLPCGTLSAYEASDWAQYVSEFVEEGCAPIQKCGDDLYWEYADGLLTITGTGDMYDYAADTDVPWYDVRGNIKTVSLPDAMTKIGQNAFYKCTAMTSINMPTSLTAIGEKAFAQDTKLACEIILPASMTNIATRAFFNCQAVTAFHIEATTPPTIPNNAFERTTAPIHVPCGYGHIYGKHAQWGELNLEMCELLQDNVYYYPIDGHTARAVTYHSNPTDTIVIPSAVVIDGVPRTVTEVADFAFTDCANLPAIYFNEGLEYIGERAFVRCYGLHGTIILPSTLETIGERTFSYCDNVEKYLIQAMTPPALGDGAFTCANHDALFYVSCEVMDDYKVATNWSSLKSRLRDACLNIYHYNTPLGTNGVYTTEDTLVASIYYRRQFTPYRWETLYLPFEVDRVTVLEDGEEYELKAWDIVYGGHYFLAKPDGMLNKEILFGFTDELESHTPYIIQFSDAYYTDKLITFYGKESWNKLSTSFEVLSSSSWMQIAGNTTMQDQLLEKPVYMLRSGLDFILQKTTTTLHPFECYVMPYATPSGTPARMNVRFRGDVPTAVESVKGNESHLTYSVDGYTLTVYPQGQAFSIYSLNGALIYSCEAGKEAVDCELNSGCYLLHAGTEAHKIML